MTNAMDVLGSIPNLELPSGICYITRSGGAWSLMPHDLPPSLSCYGYFNRLGSSGFWEKSHTSLREAARVRDGHEPTPSAAVMDSQSVKTTEKGGGMARKTSIMMGTKRSKEANAISS